MLFRGFLFAALAFNLHAQVPDNRYQALKDALGLSDSQLAQFQQGARPIPVEDPAQFELLDDSQKAKLEAVVEKVWMHPPTPSLAVAIELTSAYQWPRHPCPTEKVGAASDLVLTSFQLSQLQGLRQSAGASPLPEIADKEYRRTMLLNSGSRTDSPAVVKLVSDLSALREPVAKRRTLALAVLDDTQKTKLAAFEAALQLFSQARELRLIPCLGCFEAMCP